MTSPGVQQFLKLAKDKKVSLDDALVDAVKDEADLRGLFARERGHAHLTDPHVGLIDIYGGSEDLRTTRARVMPDREAEVGKHVFALKGDKRRKDGEPCMVKSIEEFKRHWSIFTEGSLAQFTDWSNVVAAGGSVLACLQPLPESVEESRRNLRKHYHHEAYPTSDIDLFIWGLTPEQAEVKINAIYEAVRDSVPWDVLCIRTKHAISLVSQYPYRSVQIVLRLYQSPAEILAGFDVDAACVLYDGSRIFVNPRSLAAMMRQCNTVDMTRRSPSYEVRLAKYAARGFEVFVPDLRRGDVDPTIYERSVRSVEGLARLLAVEKLSKPSVRTSYLEQRRNLRSRPPASGMYVSRNQARTYRGDLKNGDEMAGLEMNDYDSALLHIPYGPEWKAKRIARLVYQTDLGLNSTYNPKNKDRRLHRHPAFFGTMKECIEDCCGYCPEPTNGDEWALQEAEEKHFIRGRIQFIQNDPGRQTISGSFNPIDVGEWSQQAYVGPIQKLFAAIASGDRTAVNDMIKSGTVDIHRRDHVGRAPLHFAISMKATDICCDLIDAGVRITERIADGRTCLHLAAQLGLPVVLQRLIDKSRENAKKAEEEAAAAGKEEKGDEEDEDDEERRRESSEDDWSSDEDEGAEGSKKPAAQKDPQPEEDAGIPDDKKGPDVFQIDVLDWDFSLSALDFAVIGGNVDCVDVLIKAGANAKLITKANNRYNTAVLDPLTLVILTSLVADEKTISPLIKRLLDAGASSAQADEKLFSIFHAFVCSGDTKLVSQILKLDANSKAALEVPFDDYGKARLPIKTALGRGDYAMAALLLAYGAKPDFTAEEWDRLRNSPVLRSRNFYRRWENIGSEAYRNELLSTAEMTIARSSLAYELLVSCGASMSVPLRESLKSGDSYEKKRFALFDWLQAIGKLLGGEAEITDPYGNSGTGGRILLGGGASSTDSTASSGFIGPREVTSWIERRSDIMRQTRDVRSKDGGELQVMREKEHPRSMELIKALRAYYEEVVAAAQKLGAKTWDDIIPSQKSRATPRDLELQIKCSPTSTLAITPKKLPEDITPGFTFHGSRPQYGFLPYRSPQVAEVSVPLYDSLFEACWKGDNTRIRELCLAHGDKALQITVSTLSFSSDWSEQRKLGVNWGDGQYTPLSVAIMARKWDTAELILGIAAAQYKPVEENNYSEQRSQFRTTLLALRDEDDEDEHATSDDEDDEMDVDFSNGPLKFTDLAEQPSHVQCQVSPQTLLTADVTSRVSRDGQYVLDNGSILLQAIQDKDLEAFKTICDLFTKAVPETPEPDASHLQTILFSDDPRILDEYIRRSGVGVDSSSAASVDEDPDKKFYLGLTVNGKKRSDLAKPQGRKASNDLPMLWEAARLGSLEIVKYLCGSGPLDAYVHYSQASQSEHAARLRAITNLREELPGILGLTPNTRNESAITAALLAIESKRPNVLPILKSLISLRPDQAAYIKNSIHYMRLNALLLAVHQNLPHDVIQFLLNNGANIDSRDDRGWNVYHYVCANGHKELCEHFLLSLPQGKTDEQLCQKSRNAGNTPLMLAIKNGKIDLVRLLLHRESEAIKSTVMMRDSAGSLPLHIAVRSGYARVASILLVHGGEAIHCENSVGETPLEGAWMQWLLEYTGQEFPGTLSNKLNDEDTLPISGTIDAQKLVASAQSLPEDLKRLMDMISYLDKEGKLLPDSKLKQALQEFASSLEKKKTDAQQIAQLAEPAEDGSKPDRLESLKVVSAAAFASPGQRKLVHLADVQRSARVSFETAKFLAREQRAQLSAPTTKWASLFAKNEEVEDKGPSEDQKQWDGILKFLNPKVPKDIVT